MTTETAMKPIIGLLGAFDTKGEEYGYLREALRRRGAGVYAINTAIRRQVEAFRQVRLG